MATYLAIGALIAAALAGIENELRLPHRIDTPPTTFDAALDALEQSTTLRAAMGPSLHDAYVVAHKQPRLTSSQPLPVAAVPART
jgi:glutamine synthetase